MRAKTVVIGILCAIGSGLAFGGTGHAELGNARVYHNTCTAGLGSATAPAGNPETAATCLAFTAGVVAGYGLGWPTGATDALTLEGALDSKTYDRLRLTKTNCFPSRLPLDQIVRRVLLRLKFHPEEFALPTAKLVALADCYDR